MFGKIQLDLADEILEHGVGRFVTIPARSDKPVLEVIQRYFARYELRDPIAKFRF